MSVFNYKCLKCVILVVIFFLWLSEDCFLTVDKNWNTLKIGDILFSNSILLRGNEEKMEQLKPVENYNGNLVIPHYGSFLLKYFVERYCSIDVIPLWLITINKKWVITLILGKQRNLIV